jgi:prepilin-type N-terminal cleavage/methylation domain-containing protein
MHMHRDTRQGFTLIELLTVMAIIVVLAALLFPAVGKVRTKAKVMKARQEISQIDVGLRGYLDEYAIETFGDVMAYNHAIDEMELANGIELGVPLLRMLSAASDMDQEERDANPKAVPFLSAPVRSLGTGGRIAGPWVDPWGNPYKIMLDFNQDGVVSVNFTDGSGQTNLTQVPVAVWSRGADGSDKDPASANATEGNWEDDVRNW